MNKTQKFGAVLKSVDVQDDELALINAQSMTALSTDEVFAFRVAACDTLVDRQGECFDRETLEGFATMYPGRPVLRDHNWSVSTQTARIYAADVEDQDDGSARLVLRAYMVRMDGNAEMIRAIETGILREVSVGVAVKHVICSICGADQTKASCRHWPGHEYDGQTCYMTLHGAADCYEVSFVAVPAQQNAGTIKDYGGDTQSEVGDHSDIQTALAMLELY